MKKLIGLLAIFFMILVSSASAQITDRLVPHFGYMYSQVSMEGTDVLDPGSFNYTYNTLSFGTYYVLTQAKDVVSVGIDPSLNLGLNFSRAGRLNWFAQLPVFVMGRLGATSTPYNTQKIGIGAGIGFMGSYMNFMAENGRWDVKELYINPSAVVEATLNTRGSSLTGRLQFSLAPTLGEGDIVDPSGGFLLPDRQVNVSTLSIGLIYGF
jgi:hypothetical protein